jgi:hypothetical protein
MTLDAVPPRWVVTRVAVIGLSCFVCEVSRWVVSGCSLGGLIGQTFIAGLIPLPDKQTRPPLSYVTHILGNTTIGNIGHTHRTTNQVSRIAE